MLILNAGRIETDETFSFHSGLVGFENSDVTASPELRGDDDEEEFSADFAEEEVDEEDEFEEEDDAEDDFEDEEDFEDDDFEDDDDDEFDDDDDEEFEGEEEEF